LANTGTDTERLLLVALVMLAAGSGLLLIPRPVRKTYRRQGS
jgi:hypothetical protein